VYRIYALILCLCLVGCTQKKDIEVSTQKENFSYEEVSENFSKLQCGDIINIENSHYISNIAIPGRWKHTLIYLGSLKQVQELLDTSFPYYEKIVKMYKTQKEILVLDANVGGVQIRTFDQMANLKNESYLKAMTCFRFLKENTFIKDFLKNALDYLNYPYDYHNQLLDTLYQVLFWYLEEVCSLKKMNITLSKQTQVFKYRIISPTDLIEELVEKKLVKNVLILE
jgi:hypothetical protein